MGTSSIGPEIFLIGLDQDVFYQQLNANGTPMAGASFQVTAPGSAVAIAVTDPIVQEVASALTQEPVPQWALDADWQYDPFNHGLWDAR